ncbi:hypothetical protein DFS34DRAFT_591024 [Phlyctochytrium arcticum]|nr:hypothetical protein DFS34DRAFT_591024 [Phlyctochytrium arcticum]
MTAALKKVEYRGITWFKNVSKDGGARDHVIENLKEDKLPVWRWSKDQGKMWGSANDDKFMKLLKENCNIFEVLLKHLPRKVYFDIDKSTLTMDKVMNILDQYFPNAKYHISGRLEPLLAIHVVISNYVCNDEESTNLLICITALHKWDMLVYYKNSNFKHQRLISPDAIDITTLDWKSLPDLQISKRKDTKVTAKITKKQLLKMDLLSVPQQHLPIPNDFEYLEAHPLEKLKLLPNPYKGSDDILIMIFSTMF